MCMTPVWKFHFLVGSGYYVRFSDIITRHGKQHFSNITLDCGHLKCNSSSDKDEKKYRKLILLNSVLIGTHKSVANMR